MQPFTLPAYVGIILKKDNHVLLVQRKNSDWANGQWNFPGGLLESNESIVNASIRETEEELGITVDRNALHFVHIIHVRKNDTNTKDILGLYFMTESWQGTPVNKEPNKHNQIGWFDVDNLPATITEHALQALKGLQNGIIYSDNGW